MQHYHASRAREDQPQNALNDTLGLFLLFHMNSRKITPGVFTGYEILDNPQTVCLSPISRKFKIFNSQGERALVRPKG